MLVRGLPFHKMLKFHRHILNHNSLETYLHSTYIRNYLKKAESILKVTMSEFSEVVYKSVDSILDVLKKPENYRLDPVRQLVVMYEKVHAEETAKHSAKDLHALIVLEGLDGCGKSTMTKRLTRTLGGVLYGTPPKCILTLRPLFDGEEYKPLRPLFYSLGNYIAALQMTTILQEKPVILDRFWHSTACYAMAQSIEDYPERYTLPPTDSDVYAWPKDLLCPDMVLFLCVSEQVRKMRLGGREELTTQEHLLASRQLFRNNVVELYKRMFEPKVIFVNGQLTKSKVEKEILRHVQNITEFKEIAVSTLK